MSQNGHSKAFNSGHTVTSTLHVMFTGHTVLLSGWGAVVKITQAVTGHGRISRGSQGNGHNTVTPVTGGLRVCISDYPLLLSTYIGERVANSTVSVASPPVGFG